MKKNKNASRRRKIIITLVAVIFVCIISSGIYFLWGKDSSNKTPLATPDARENLANDDINLSPPTQEELDSNQTHKSDLPANGAIVNPSSGKSVTPIISYANQETAGDPVIVNAYIPGFLENGGTCTLRLTKEASVLQTTTRGVADASATYCPELVIPFSQLKSPGTWTATVVYSSSSVSGNSKDASVVVK